LQRRPINIW